MDENGNAISTSGSKLAVFNGSSVAGVSSVISGPNSTRLFNVNIYSDTTPESGMTYQVYDASSGRIVTLAETYDFASLGTTGSLAHPIILHITKTQGINLVQGWNWVSFSVFPASGASLDSFLSGYTPQENDQIIGSGGMATYSGGTWYPSSTPGSAAFTIEPWKMYKILRQASGTAAITATGTASSLSTATLTSGWYWFGYPRDSAVDINTLFSRIQASDDDYIMSQDGTSATYYDGVWYPNNSATFSFQAGKGYFFYLSIPQQGSFQ